MFRKFFLFIGATLFGSAAFAECTSPSCTTAPAQTCSYANSPKRWVGDMNADARCTDGSLQSALQWIADNNPGSCPSVVYLTNEIDYVDQALTIDGTANTLKIVGLADGAVCGDTDLVACTPTCPPPRLIPSVTLRGTSGQSIFHITGDNELTLRYLTLTRAMLDDDQTGGAIYFNGSGSLTLDTTAISFNQAGAGGGIEFIGAPLATLHINQNNVIIGNTASSGDGGGIRIEGGAHLIMTQPNSVITSNHAPNGNGGGIDVVGPALADIGVDVYGGVLSNNDASNGGAIAALDIGSGGPIVQVFSDANHRPAVINANKAAHLGGAFYGTGGAHLCMLSPSVTNNIAEDGAAFYVASDRISHPKIYLDVLPDPDNFCETQPLTAIAGHVVTCYSTLGPCDVISGNSTQHADGTGSAGAVIYAGIGDIFSEHTTFQDNVASNLIRLFYSGGDLSLCVITDNRLSGSVLDSWFWSTGSLGLSHCTIANNVIDDPYVARFREQSNIHLNYNLIQQPEKSSVYFTPYASGDGLRSSFNVASEIASLSDVTNVKGEATFFDAAHRNYVPSRCSVAVDVGIADPAVPLDYMDQTYGFDDLSMSNVFGT
ncbi:MAG TPA: right-handed parallel beta-helix repeat-containing protein, partial [Rudaea sp.]